MTAIGNAMDNVLVVNPYDNVLIGREGHDTLRGQAGADTFVIDEELKNANVKTIKDFNTNAAVEGDILKIRSWDLGVITQKERLEPAYILRQGVYRPDDIRRGDFRTDRDRSLHFRPNLRPALVRSGRDRRCRGAAARILLEPRNRDRDGHSPLLTAPI